MKSGVCRLRNRSGFTSTSIFRDRICLARGYRHVSPKSKTRLQELRPAKGDIYSHNGLNVLLAERGYVDLPCFSISLSGTADPLSGNSARSKYLHGVSWTKH